MMIFCPFEVLLGLEDPTNAKGSRRKLVLQNWEGDGYHREWL
jgi:hypothetical protein